MNRSTFPAKIDEFLEHFDMKASDKASVERYKTLMLKTSLTAPEQAELQTLTTTLREKIFTAEDFNKLQDCIVNLETFFRDNVEGYIETKQDEFNATIGKFSYKGDYNSTTTYQKWNIVTYNHESFISKIDNNLNRPPSGLPNDANWGKIASRGAQGVAGIGLSYVGQYNNATAYQIGNAVTYNDKIYYCKQASTGNLPTNETYWTLFMSGGTIYVSATAPTSPVLYQTWIDTN